MAAIRNAKGPASVGALPDHGSNNPDQENAVNTATDTTTPGASATIPYRWEHEHPTEAMRITPEVTR